MAVINHSKREINAKIVYYGPEGVGKASLFRFIHQRIKPSLSGPLKAMQAGGDNLNFFEFAPFESSTIDGYKVKFLVYTMTGTVNNPATWKMTLKGVDGLAIVLDAAAQKDVNRHSIQSLRKILAGYGRDLHEIPSSLILFSCDLADGAGCMDGVLPEQVPVFNASTATGEGILPSLASLTQSVMQRLRSEFEQSSQQTQASEVITESCDPELEHQEPLSLEDEAELVDIRVMERTYRIEIPSNGPVYLPLDLEVGGQMKSLKLAVTISVDRELK